MATDDDIPIIDITDCLADRPGALGSVARQIREACLGTGFFQITGHGVDKVLIEDAFSAHRRFHARPLEEKLKLKLNRWHRGYEPFASSQLKSSARFEPAKYPNQLESFFLRHEVDPETPGYGEKELLGPNQWPDDDAFRETIAAYDETIRQLGLSLLPAMSVAVGEAADFLMPFFDPPSTALRLIHYPAGPTKRPADLLGIQPHTDYGFITILIQDEVDGLEIQRVDGGWVRAPRVPGAFIVNIGDALARWTNDAFNSTPHRVRADAVGRDRFSIAMFFDPNVEAEIRCFDTFKEAGEARHAPVRYGSYFSMRLDANFLERA